MISRSLIFYIWTKFLSSASTARLGLLLCACIVLGGTSQYIYSYKVPLYIVSLVFLGLILTSSNRRPLSALKTMPVMLIGGFAGLFALYSIPIGPEMWSSLRGRTIAVEGFGLLNQDLPWLPISLHPERTFLALFDFLPIAAVMLITLLSNNKKEILWAKYSLLFIVFISCLLGLAQLIVNTDTVSLYDLYSKGRPIGFFSNTSHFASLCAMVIPLAFYIVLKGTKGTATRNASMGIGRVASAILIIIFSALCILSKSSAGYLLLLLVITASPLLIMRNSHSLKKMFVILLFCLILLLADFFFFSGEFLDFLNKFSTSNGGTSRGAIYKTVLSFRADFGFFGIGPGAFEDVYKIYENQDEMTRLYVNQPHNGFLALWVEFGVLGILAILISLITFLALWFKQIKNGRSHTAVYLLAISVPILHSFVEYPFRTIAISSVFIFMLSLIYRGSNAFENAGSRS